MKYLIYDLFSGVGFCNQLFSLETAIYLANITNRKLILLIKNPLCHCGRASWDYGHFLDYFSDDYKKFLPYGIEVYYKVIPENIINKITTAKHIFKEKKFSHTCIVDSTLDTEINATDIKLFCQFRTKYIINFNDLREDYIYINTSNASRCFYNFYTNKPNYEVMTNICRSLTFIKANNSNIVIERPYLAIHLRLGDVKHDKTIIDMESLCYYESLKSQINTIKQDTDDNIKQIVVMADRKDGKIIQLLKQDFNVTFTDELIDKLYETSISSNQYPNNKVLNFLIQKNICKYSDYFIGCEGSTVSNYLQYLHFLDNKKYSNLYTSRTIKYSDTNQYTWNCNTNINGPGIGWKLFFPENIKKSKPFVLITLTNDGYLDLTRNLLISMKQLGIDHLLKIYCIGEESYNYFNKYYPNNTIVQINTDNNYLKSWVEYKSIQNSDIEGKRKWSDITSYKIYAINNELKIGNDVIFTDGDITFEKNPIPYLFDNINDCDLFIQNDNQDHASRKFCTGFFLMKSNPITIEITNFNNIQKNLKDFINDQNYLRKFEDKLNVKYLPLSLFPNGKYWRDNFNGLDPYIIHFNYDVALGKIKRMRSFNKWHIPVMLFSEWINYIFPQNDIIINSSVEDYCDSFTYLPIGVQHDYLKYINTNNNGEFLKHPLRNSLLCLSNIRCSTDNNRRGNNNINRKIIRDTLVNKKFITFKTSDAITYFKDIGRYKFVICPEGNGIDTHRLWETIYSKGIPIVEDNPQMREKCKGLPILWTTDYSELTEEYLNKQYTYFLDKSFDFTMLFLNSYQINDKNLIKSRSKFWCSKRNLNDLYQKYYT